MRFRPETLLIAAMSIFAATGVAALIFQDIRLGAHDPVTVEPAFLVEPAFDPTSVGIESGSEWLAKIRGYCNPVDVETRLRWQPAPDTEDGVMNEAACYALAGKIDLARSAIERLPEVRRYEAAGVVFGAGHAAADAGDELAAGPLMELVVEFWPNHYMALYHAGAAAYERGEQPAAQEYLNRFLVEYAVEDGWRASALSMLGADVR